MESSSKAAWWVDVVKDTCVSIWKEHFPSHVQGIADMGLPEVGLTASPWGCIPAVENYKPLHLFCLVVCRAIILMLYAGMLVTTEGKQVGKTSRRLMQAGEKESAQRKIWCMVLMPASVNCM